MQKRAGCSDKNALRSSENVDSGEVFTRLLTYDRVQGGMSWFVTFPSKNTTPCRGVLRGAPIVSASETRGAWVTSGRAREVSRNLETDY